MAVVSRSVLVGMLSCLVAGHASAKDVFRCVIKETRHVSDDGRLIVYPKDIYAGDAVMVDTLSGLVTMWTNRYQFRIVQTGTSENSWILSREMVGPVGTSVFTIAVKVFQAGTPFIMTDLGAVHSGQCAVIR